jgi:hypothetical protein
MERLFSVLVDGIVYGCGDNQSGVLGLGTNHVQLSNGANRASYEVPFNFQLQPLLLLLRMGHCGDGKQCGISYLRVTKN